MVDNNKEVMSNDCRFVIIAELPNKNCHEVLINSEVIKQFINAFGEFKITEDKLPVSLKQC